MIWLAVWLVGALIAMPLIGRDAAKDYARYPRRAGQVTPLTAAIVFGLLWPGTLVIIALVWVCLFLADQDKASIRVLLTGTKEKF